MTDPVGNAGEGRGSGGTPPGMPRWVKVLAIVVLAAVLVSVVIMLVVDGEHGPGIHGAVDRSGILSSVLMGGPGPA